MNYGPQSDVTRARLDLERQSRLEQSEQAALDLGRPLLNHLIFEGFLGEKDPVRYTAVGAPVIKCLLRHLSRQEREPSNRVQRGVACRDVICELGFVCIGTELCNKLSTIALGTLVKVEGYLTRNTYKQDLSWVILELQSIEVVDH